MSVNKTIILGRLGQDPEVKHTPNGNPVCSFSVATSENWKDKSGKKQEKVEWHRVIVWGTLAEVCGKYLSKGRQVYLEGKLQTRSWEKDGHKFYATEIVADKIEFVGDSKKEEGQGKGDEVQNNPEPQYEASKPSQTFTQEDIPF